VAAAIFRPVPGLDKCSLVTHGSRRGLLSYAPAELRFGQFRAFHFYVVHHDAPIYTVVEEIVEHSGTPYFCFNLKTAAETPAGEPSSSVASSCSNGSCHPLGELRSSWKPRQVSDLPTLLRVNRRF
jgi:hypothetical protein